MIELNNKLLNEALPACANPVLSAAAVKLSKAKIRVIVFDKCAGKCAYCGVDLVKGWNVDHIKPQILGGTNVSRQYEWRIGLPMCNN